MLATRLFSVLRKDNNTIRTNSHITTEVEAVFLAGIRCGVKTVAILEFRIVNGRPAVDPHQPLAATRKPDIKRMKIPIWKVHHDDNVIAGPTVAKAMESEGFVLLVNMEHVYISPD